jgi:hypothetical protein
MLEDDYKRIMDYFHQSIEGKPLNLEELCRESVEFFQKLKEYIEHGTDKEKEEAYLLMHEMYKRLMVECKQLTEKTGLTEEQILSFAENPNNFSSAQWQMIQETRQDMVKTGQALSQFLKKDQEHVPIPKPKSPPSSKKKKIVKSKKSNWMRS